MSQFEYLRVTITANIDEQPEIGKRIREVKRLGIWESYLNLIT